MRRSNNYYRVYPKRTRRMRRYGRNRDHTVKNGAKYSQDSNKWGNRAGRRLAKFSRGTKKHDRYAKKFNRNYDNTKDRRLRYRGRRNNQESKKKHLQKEAFLRRGRNYDKNDYENRRDKHTKSYRKMGKRGM